MTSREMNPDDSGDLLTSPVVPPCVDFRECLKNLSGYILELCNIKS